VKDHLLLRQGILEFLADCLPERKKHPSEIDQGFCSIGGYLVIEKVSKTV
jgi:hypothetical protein